MFKITAVYPGSETNTYRYSTLVEVGQILTILASDVERGRLVSFSVEKD